MKLFDNYNKKRIKCTLLCHSNSPHVQQLYTGFQILSDNGTIKLVQKICEYQNRQSCSLQHLRDAFRAHLRVVVEVGGMPPIQLYFDNHDSHEIQIQSLESCDYYFKRSYLREYIFKDIRDYAHKIYPLGLNYLVYPNNIGKSVLNRYFKLSAKCGTKIKKILELTDFNRYYPRLMNIEAPPIYSLQPKILFMATAYDPYDIPDRSKEKIEERTYNNEFRAACIRSLRKALGDKFYGGFNYTQYTLEKFKDVLIDVPERAAKGSYLDMVRKFPICVATTGLHGSIGWKFAEYVAFSKAILSERLRYEVPGRFCSGENYIEFSSPDECVDKSLYLINNKKIICDLMDNNYKYYKSYVRPDMLVENALIVAINNMH